MMAFFYELVQLVQDLENEINCDICLMRMENPKALSCLHSFCVICIQEHMKKKGDVHCPTCRKVTSIPNGNPMLLQTSFFVNRICDLLDKHEKYIKDSKAEPEPGQKSSELCSNCEQLLRIENNVSFREPKKSTSAGLRDGLLEAHFQSSFNADKMDSKAQVVRNDGLLNAFRQRKASVPVLLSQQDTSDVKLREPMRRRHTDPAMLDNAQQQYEIPEACLKEAASLKCWQQCIISHHTYQIELQKHNYEIGTVIEFSFLPTCTHCSSRLDVEKDDIKAMLHESSHKNKTLFSESAVKDGIVLFACKAERKGQFVISVEVNGKTVHVENCEIRVDSCRPSKQWKVEICS